MPWTSATTPVDQDSKNIRNSSEKKQSTTAEYVFVEEALFLNEHGLFIRIYKKHEQIC